MRCLRPNASFVRLLGVSRGMSTFVRPSGKPPKSKLSSWLDNAKDWDKQFNETHPHYRKFISFALLALYGMTAYEMYQYLKDTEWKVTGTKNPNSQEEVQAKRPSIEIYNELATEYDNMIWKEEALSIIWWLRRKVMKQVRGNALEVACGTGRNIKYLRPENIKSITFMDASLPMLQVSQEKFMDKFSHIEDKAQFVKGESEELLNLAAGSGQKFDTIYETFGLCSYKDPVLALKNFKDLLARDGKVILLEHGRSHKYASLNERLDKGADKRWEKWGCNWNLDIQDIVNKSGFEVVEEHQYQFGTVSYFVLKLPEVEL